MKKIAGVFVILSVIIVSMVATSCGIFDRAKESLEETYNIWYKYNREVNVPLGETEAGGTLSDAEVYVQYDADDGLTILICTTQAQEISYLGGAYSVTADVTTGAEKKYSADEFRPAKWMALIASGNFEEEDPPTITVKLDDILGGNLSLKRFLINLAANKLLEDE